MSNKIDHNYLKTENWNDVFIMVYIEKVQCIQVNLHNYDQYYVVYKYDYLKARKKCDNRNISRKQKQKQIVILK